MRKSYRLILAAGLILIVTCWAFLDTIPPKSLTDARMQVTKRRVLRYASVNNVLPHDLSNLPALPKYDNSIIDGWGRPILYAIGIDEVITLTSYGKDGRPGGSGDDVDVVRRFASRKNDGTWSDEYAAWLKER